MYPIILIYLNTLIPGNYEVLHKKWKVFSNQNSELPEK